MTTINGFAGLKNRIKEKEEQIAEANKPKANWFKLQSGETKVIQFLQELDENCEKYDPKAGVFLGAVEHQAPGKKGFMSRALDTRESEGRDFAQELYQSDREKYKDLRPRENFYINVATKNEEGEVEAQILSRSLHGQFVQDLIELVEDDFPEGITGIPFKLTRRGEGPQTIWKIKALGEDDKLDISGVQPWDLESHAVRHIPYEKQAEYYQRNSDIDLTGNGGGGTNNVITSSFDQPQEEDTSETYSW